MNDINEYISKCVVGMINPGYAVNEQDMCSRFPIRFDGWDVIEKVVPMPGCKFTGFSCSNSNEASKFVNTWEDVSNSMLGNLNSLYTNDGTMKRKTISSYLFIRGSIPPSYWTTTLPKTLTKVSQKLHTPYPVNYKTYTQSRDTPNSISLIYNSNTHLPYLKNLLTRARCMYQSGAYLHWYAKYIDEEKVGDLFEECFECLQGVVDEYQEFL